ncbi:hypothetical protein Enr17x_42590 [Gimesia fumaroli]|uniref:Uncharacterized protein n=1 Tax=Gimesia fumaroli TaxID=2527976 RepID=A0A518IGI8_9PLAN|nr:hypothetical protein Enr17x_42590 [Gimesia fumaroli]
MKKMNMHLHSRIRNGKNTKQHNTYPTEYQLAYNDEEQTARSTDFT